MTYLINLRTVVATLKEVIKNEKENHEGEITSVACMY